MSRLARFCFCTGTWASVPGAAVPSLGLLVLRVGFGLLMATQHGWGKLTGFREMAPNFPDPIGVGSTMSLALAVGAEFFCSLLLVVGLMTRWATLPLIITMSVAAFHIHAADPISGKELALMYLVGYVVLLCAGPGRFSADAVLSRAKPARPVDET